MTKRVTVGGDLKIQHEVVVVGEAPAKKEKIELETLMKDSYLPSESGIKEPAYSNNGGQTS